jgi:hypothetical protein
MEIEIFITYYLLPEYVLMDNGYPVFWSFIYDEVLNRQVELENSKCL